MLTMEEAMKQSGALPFASGSIVKGQVIEVRPKEVLVDIGYKSEGVISANNFARRSLRSCSINSRRDRTMFCRS